MCVLSSSVFRFLQQTMREKVFQPQPPELAALSARLKEQFDPRNILNPGRMAAA